MDIERIIKDIEEASAREIVEYDFSECFAALRVVHSVNTIVRDFLNDEIEFLKGTARTAAQNNAVVEAQILLARARNLQEAVNRGDELPTSDTWKASKGV